MSNEQDNTISVIDGESLAVAATIEVGMAARGLALNREGTKLYVAVGDDNRIGRRRSRNAPCPRFDRVLGSDPEFFAVHPDGKRLFVANEDDNRISVIDIFEKQDH